MIEEKDIKAGLKFVLPFEEEQRYLEAKIRHDEYIPNRTTTIIESISGEEKVISACQPIFTVEDVNGIYARISCLAIPQKAEKQFCVATTFIADNGKIEGVVQDIELSKEDECDRIKQDAEQVNHPSHYSWLKDLCGVEPIDICRYFGFSIGNALKYLMRKDKVDGDKTKTEKRVEDLRKAVFYIEDEIKRLENGKE